MAIDIGDDNFRRWFSDQPFEVKRDLELFWRKEVIRHPFIKANPTNAAQLRRTMVLQYAYDEYQFDPEAPLPEPEEAEPVPERTWRSRWPKQQ